MTGLASVTVLPVGPLRAPDHFTAAQAQIWTDVSTSKAPGFFGRDSIGLLEKYCVALDRSRFITEQLNAISSVGSRSRLERFERLAKMEKEQSMLIASLATKMRLTQQSRYKPDSAVAAKAAPEMPTPWQNQS